MLAEVFPPGEFLREELDTRGWLQADFAAIVGKDAKTVSDIISGKRSITPDMAMLIGEALDTGPAVWLNLENDYQLHKAAANRPTEGHVSQRAEIYEQYPIREMVKRGWITQTSDVHVLKRELSDFFSPDELPYAARRSDDSSKKNLQKAWLHRAYNIARELPVSSYSELALARALNDLKEMMGEPREMVQIPRVLSGAGIRFLLVEALPSSKIDGVCFWLDNKNPVVALSTRLDRIDNFWFTLIHELQHVKHRHGQDLAMLDIDIRKRDSDLSKKERLADEGAEEYLVPREEIENFVARVSPLFSATRIKEFARRIGVHPGIVVGQLQHMEAIPWSHHKKALVSVRGIVTSTTPHDGWGMVA